MDPYIYFNNCPVIDSLSYNWKIIKEEFYSALIHIDILKQDKILSNDLTSSGKKPNALDILYSGSFKGINLYIKDSLIDSYEKEEMKWKEYEKERINPLINKMPFMKDFFKKNKNLLGSITFNISHPGSTLRHHFGLDPNYIRIHLCLLEDKRCVFDIENNRHIWSEGEIFGFDDYYVLHGTRHYPDGHGPRIIMLMDINKDYLKPYAKTWPCRNQRPNIKELLPLNDWDDQPINYFVKANIA